MAATTESEIVTRMRADLTEATRQRDQVRLDTIRMALDGFTQEEVARNRAELSEQDRVVILGKQIKQRNDAAEIFRNAGRTELADKETRQAEILRAYMPQMLGDDEVREQVSRLIAEHGKVFKTIMPLAAKELRGRADSRRVSEIVHEMTA